MTNKVISLSNLSLSVADTMITQQGKTLDNAAQYVKLSISNPDTLKANDGKGNAVMPGSLIITPKGKLNIPVTATMTAYEPSGNPLLVTSNYTKDPFYLPMEISVDVKETDAANVATYTYTGDVYFTDDAD